MTLYLMISRYSFFVLFCLSGWFSLVLIVTVFFLAGSVRVVAALVP